MAKTLDIPGLGKMFRDHNIDTWLVSRPTVVPMLGYRCGVTVENYETDPRPADFHVAARNFMNAKPTVLKAAEADLYRFYKDYEEDWLASDENAKPIEQADIWKHIQFDEQPLITRRAHGDKGVYVTLECKCDWDEEHGLQIVLKNGEKVTKLGPYDGHLTNSDSYGDKKLDNVVYVGRDQL